MKAMNARIPRHNTYEKGLSGNNSLQGAEKTGLRLG